MPELDPTNPSHYTSGDIECVDAIRAATKGLDGFSGFLAGNAIKYVWRHSLKGKAVEDLQKAQWYIDRLIRTVRVDEVVAEVEEENNYWATVDVAGEMEYWNVKPCYNATLREFTGKPTSLVGFIPSHDATDAMVNALGGRLPMPTKMIGFYVAE